MAAYMCSINNFNSNYGISKPIGPIHAIGFWLYADFATGAGASPSSPRKYEGKTRAQLLIQPSVPVREPLGLLHVSTNPQYNLIPTNNIP